MRCLTLYLLGCLLYTLPVAAQTTAGLPPATLVDKAGRTTSTTSISDFDNPVVVVNFKESCGSCVQFITDLNNNYSSKGAASQVKLVAIVNDKFYSASTATMYSNRWRQVDTYFDRDQQMKTSLLPGDIPIIYFMDDNQQVVYSHDGVVPKVDAVYTLASRIRRKEITAQNLYYDSTWWPTTAQQSVYYRKQEKLANGNWQIKDYYKNGTLQMVGEANPLHPMIRQNKFQYYHPNGKLAEESWYYNNQLSLKLIRWYDDGSKEYEANYEGGKLHNRYNYYYRNGKVYMTGNYSYGKKSGEWKKYYQSGKQSGIANFLNGKLTGQARGWHENGNIMYDVIFDNDVLNFTASPKFLAENGRSLMQFTRNGNDYTISYYNEKGTLIAKADKSNGVLEYSSYFDNGNLAERTTMKNETTVNGKWILWYENGQKLAEATYFDNKLAGKSMSWYADGTIRERHDYDAGTSEYFDKQGQRQSNIPEPFFLVKKGQTVDTRNLTKSIRWVEEYVKSQW